MAYGARDFAGEPLYWALIHLIHRGGMAAVTVRAAAAEAGCSVGLMRHYYDNKSQMLACAYELVADLQLRRLEEILWARREPLLNPTPASPLGPARAADLLVSCLSLADDSQLVVGVQLSFHAMARHDGPIGEAVGTQHRRLEEDCRAVLREAGVPDDALASEGVDLRVLLTGLVVVVPGLATEDEGVRQGTLAPEQAEGIVRRHLEAAVARHALDAAG